MLHCDLLIRLVIDQVRPNSTSTMQLLVLIWHSPSMLLSTELEEMYRPDSQGGRSLKMPCNVHHLYTAESLPDSSQERVIRSHSGQWKIKRSTPESRPRGKPGYTIGVTFRGLFCKTYQTAVVCNREQTWQRLTVVVLLR